MHTYCTTSEENNLGTSVYNYSTLATQLFCKTVDLMTSDQLFTATKIFSERLRCAVCTELV